MLALMLPLALAAAPLAGEETAAIEAAVRAIYAPYARAVPEGGGGLDAAIYSAETAALLARWKQVAPADEPDRLSGGDWLCQCQDWDARAFAVAIAGNERLGPGRARVAVRLALGHGATRHARLVLVREGAAWRLDDMVSADMPEGLKATIRRTIAEDLAGRRETGR